MITQKDNKIRNKKQAVPMQVTQNGNYTVNIDDWTVIVNKVNDCNNEEKRENNIIKTTGPGPGTGYGGLKSL